MAVAKMLFFFWEWGLKILSSAGEYDMFKSVKCDRVRRMRWYGRAVRSGMLVLKVEKVLEMLNLGMPPIK